jgi:hypothetical protein
VDTNFYADMYTDVYTVISTAMYRDYLIGANLTLIPPVVLKVLRQITRNFRYLDEKVFLKLYKQYVRPHLEFASPAWRPWQQGDILTMERVQEKAFQQITSLKGNTYEERCTWCEYNQMRIVLYLTTL